MTKKKQKACCPICNEKMKLVEEKQVSAVYKCSKHGRFVVAFMEEKNDRRN